jgi:hypothetical protein
LAKLDQDSVGEIMPFIDPNFQPRTDAFMDKTAPMVTKKVTDFEPVFRVDLTEADARRFTLNPLNDINRLFGTPSGSAHAVNVMLITTDLDVLSKMSSNGPKLLQGFLPQMPEVKKRAQAKVASLPRRGVEGLFTGGSSYLTGP